MLPASTLSYELQGFLFTFPRACCLMVPSAKSGTPVLVQQGKDEGLDHEVEAASSTIVPAGKTGAQLLAAAILWDAGGHAGYPVLIPPP